MDQVSSAIHQIQDPVDRLIPVVEEVLFIFGWAEVEGVVDAVDAATDNVFVVQVADFLLTIVLFDAQQLTDASEGQLSVALTNYADVMLHKHAF